MTPWRRKPKRPPVTREQADCQFAFYLRPQELERNIREALENALDQLLADQARRDVHR
jgi:hypothetical protein